MSDDGISFDSKPLDNLIKILKSQGATAKIGVLGSKNVRESNENGSNSNATIGAAHEFGTSKLPQRSFLRMPITEKLPAKIEESGALDEALLKRMIKEGSFAKWTEQIAIMAVATVLEAFDTSGYGKWQPSNMEHKKVKQTLVETHQLRDSITYEIKQS